MKYLHTHEDFKYFINETSKKINLSEIIVEKDYWVTYLLKKLVDSEFSQEIVFKGGTCLSKAYNLIERYSEDIDLLILETEKTKSKTQKGKRLVAMRDFVSYIQELNYTIGNRAELYASFRFLFPTMSQKILNSIGKEILLEPGYRGGINPKIQKKFITSYVENLLNGKLEDYDTKPFEINALSIERIFIEKLFALKEIYDKDGGVTLQTKTRHYYDIYKLLETKEIQALLKNKTMLEEIINDINNIGQKYFSLEAVTLTDLINHIALKPDEILFKKLKQGYVNDRDLYNEHINFEEIINTIRKI